MTTCASLAGQPHYNTMNQLLVKAQAQLQRWRDAKENVLAQLSSIANLTEQLETLNSCQKRGKLGVLSNCACVIPLLQAKIVESMERALGYVFNERRILTEVTQQLKRLSKDGEAVFERIVGLQGFEVASKRTADSFSLNDYAWWLKQLYSAYKCNTDEKLAILQLLQYTTEYMSQICNIWQREPEGIEDVLEHMQYTLSSVSA